jgi:hypothetical protein
MAQTAVEWFDQLCEERGHTHGENGRRACLVESLAELQKITNKN